MALAETLRSVAELLEAPFRFDWATSDDLDARPFGGETYLPAMAVLYLVSLTFLKLFAGATWLEAPLKPFVFVNNVAMCVYSCWAMIIVGALFIANWSDSGFDLVAPLCQKDHSLLLKDLDFQFYIFCERAIIFLFNRYRPCCHCQLHNIWPLFSAKTAHFTPVFGEKSP